MAGRPKATDGPVSRLVNRRISGAVTRLILRYAPHTSPNLVSLVVLAFSLTALPLYVRGYAWAAGIVVQLSSALDGVDGELARATGKTSRLGAVLDSVLDRFSNLVFLTGALLYSYRYESLLSEEALLALAVLSVWGDMMVTFIHSKYTEILGVHPALAGRFPNIASRDVRLFLLFAFSLAGQVTLGLLAVTLISLVYSAARTLELLLSPPERGKGQEG